MPKIDPKKSGFEKWNEAVDTAYKKNQDLIEGMSGIGSVMGSLGQAVGGAAGEWLNWGANVVQAVANCDSSDHITAWLANYTGSSKYGCCRLRSGRFHRKHPDCGSYTRSCCRSKCPGRLSPIFPSLPVGQ